MLASLDIPTIVQEAFFTIFAIVTSLVAAIAGPTYDNLVVPALQPAALFPSLTSGAGSGTNYLAPAAHFSTYLLVNLVDPAVTLVAVGVALLFLSKSLVRRWAERIDDLLPRLVIAVIGANFTTPIAGAVLGVAASVYPVVAGWDGGSWQQWTNLAGWGEFGYSWDNGTLAFVLAFAEFAAVFALLLAIGIRDALLAVLLVLLPPFMLLWPFRPFASIPQRAWLLFAELAFLPCVLVVPLELAVGSSNPVMLVAYLGVAVASPFLLSTAGTRLVAFGFPSAGGVVSGGSAQGLSQAPRAAGAPFGPVAASIGSSSAGGRALGGGVRVAGSAAAPAAAPLAVGELLGHAGLGLVRHIQRSADPSGRAPHPPAMRPRGSGGGGR